MGAVRRRLFEFLRVAAMIASLSALWIALVAPTAAETTTIYPESGAYSVVSYTDQVTETGPGGEIIYTAPSYIYTSPDADSFYIDTRGFNDSTGLHIAGEQTCFVPTLGLCQPADTLMDSSDNVPPSTLHYATSFAQVQIAGDYYTQYTSNDGKHSTLDCWTAYVTGPCANPVYAWGANGSGQLDTGDTLGRNTPVQLSGLSNIIAIGAGWNHSLTVSIGGTVQTWGNNAYGQLGNGTTTGSLAPVPVSNLSGVAAVAGGSDFSLALKSDGTVWAWGRNDVGQLGDGSTTQKTTPVRVSGLTGVQAIAAGGSHGMALKTDGTLWAWGDNSEVRLILWNGPD